MSIEYKIASITYTGYNDEGYYEEKQTLNHVFISEKNPEFEEEEPEDGYDRDNEPEFMAVSLCHKFKNSFNVGENENEFNSHTVNYYELNQDFWKSKTQRMCKICYKKLRKLESKKKASWNLIAFTTFLNPRM